MFGEGERKREKTKDEMSLGIHALEQSHPTRITEKATGKHSLQTTTVHVRQHTQSTSLCKQ